MTMRNAHRRDVFDSCDYVRAMQMHYHVVRRHSKRKREIAAKGKSLRLKLRQIVAQVDKVDSKCGKKTRCGEIIDECAKESDNAKGQSTRNTEKSLSSSRRSIDFMEREREREREGERETTVDRKSTFASKHRTVSDINELIGELTEIKMLLLDNLFPQPTRADTQRNLEEFFSVKR